MCGKLALQVAGRDVRGAKRYRQGTDGMPAAQPGEGDGNAGDRGNETMVAVGVGDQEVNADDPALLAFCEGPPDEDWSLDDIAEWLGDVPEGIG